MRRLASNPWSVLLASLAAAALGCGDGDKPPQDASTEAAMDGPARDAPTEGGTAAEYLRPACDGVADYMRPERSCTPRDTDYTPGADDDMWPPCISDDGTYHPIESTISSLARVAAYERIAQLLFDPERDPSPQEFTQARMIYQEMEGLDSRLSRRYDPHYDSMGADCTTDPSANPDYCVGPAHLQPLVLDSFAAGMSGSGALPSRLLAARIDAALLWFLYVSQYKESLTCTTKAKDCDSSYAYYTGCDPTDTCNNATDPGGQGLARRVKELGPEGAQTHLRAWHGALAVRCWRDLDSATTAMDLEMRDRARNQYDRAVLHGVALIVRDALQKLCDDSVSEGPELGYWWEFARTLGPVLLREMRERNATEAQRLEQELQRERSADVQVLQALQAIDAVFDCP